MFRDFRQALLHEGRGSIILALPLVAGQVSQMLVGLADTIMVGRLGVLPLAAVTFANSILYLPLMFGIGMTMAISIRVSQARGADEPAGAREALRNGLYVALGVGVLTVLLALALLPFLGWFGQEPDVVREARWFFPIVAVSMIPAIGAMAVKNHADAMNHPWPAFWIMLGGVGLNVFLNWVFIWGKLGAPAWGIEGAAVATLLARIAMLAGLLVWCRRSHVLRGWVPERWLRLPDWRAMRSLVKVGFPASLHLLAEVSAFVLATFLIGTISKEALASHQVAISCAATVFMVPLGLSMALTVRVGEAWGARQWGRLRPIVLGGWIMGVAFTAFTAPAFLWGNEVIARQFIDEPVTLGMTAALLIVAAAFQVADAQQILSAGILRGVNDVTIPAWIAFFAYWVVSLPIGWWLAFRLEMGVTGMWWGITVGLFVTALALGARAWRLTSASLAQEEAEADLADKEDPLLSPSEP